MAIKQQNDYGKIRIYTKLDTLKFRDENFKDEVSVRYMKIDLEERRQDGKKLEEAKDLAARKLELEKKKEREVPQAKKKYQW